MSLSCDSFMKIIFWVLRISPLCECVHECVCVWMYVAMCMWVNMYVCASVCMCMYMRMYICERVYVCVWVCVYDFFPTRLIQLFYSCNSASLPNTISLFFFYLNSRIYTALILLRTQNISIKIFFFSGVSLLKLACFVVIYMSPFLLSFLLSLHMVLNSSFSWKSCIYLECWQFCLSSLCFSQTIQ